MQVGSVTPNPPGATATTPSANAANQNAASAAFGLSFESLLQIIMTQLTYQDPLKPMENFEFVSQLAQFSQIQIGQTGNDRLEMLVAAQANAQATGLLGRDVNVANSTGQPITGTVTRINFVDGMAVVSIKTPADVELDNIAIGNITQIREGS